MTPHILVTGSHRSGTTWVGKVLATAPKTRYLLEPFNVAHPNPYVPVCMKHWYTWLDSDSGTPEKQAFQEVLSFHMRYPRIENAHPKQLAKRLRDRLRDRLHAWSGYRVILKDPIALLSTAWLARNFGIVPVVCIRHPAAFVSSLQLKRWVFDFHSFLDQPGLIDEFWPNQHSQIRDLSERQNGDFISEAAYLWRLLHQVIAKFRRDYPKWIYVRHEDLSRQPVDGFRRLYADLQLPYADATDVYLKSTISREDQSYVLSSTGVEDVTRDSLANVKVWKKRLSESEVARIREITGEVGATFYPDSEW